MRLILACIFATFCGCQGESEIAEEAEESMRPTLSEPMYGVVGRPIKVAVRNLFLVPTKATLYSNALDWRMLRDVWVTHAGAPINYWSDVVTDYDYNYGFSTHVSPPGKLAGSLLIIGDSITAKGYYVEDLFELTSATLLGTKQFRNNHIRHEGVPGATFKRFATSATSPLVFNGRLNVREYLARVGRPNVIVWFLGTNDIFARKTLSPNEDFYYATELRKAFHGELPEVKQFYVSLPPGNDRQEAFDHDYKPPYNNMLEWRKKWFEWNSELYSKFPTIPAHMSIDPVEDYPPTNALHLNRSGHRALAQVIYARLLAASRDEGSE